MIFARGNCPGALGRDHLNGCLCDEVVEPHARGRDQLDHLILAVFVCDAVLRVGGEPRVETAAVHVDVLGLDDPEAPCKGAGGGVGGAVVEVGVCGEFPIGGGEGSWGGGGLLEVWSLGLNHAHKEVSCVVCLVLVEHAVLGCSSVEPGWALGFDEDATGDVDVDLGLCGDVEIVVSDPGPDVFHVRGGGGGQVEEHRSGDAAGRDLAGELGAFTGGELGAAGASDAEVGVPHGRGALRGLFNVPLHQDDPSGSTAVGEHHVCDLDDAAVTCIANLDHGAGVVHIRKVLSGTHNLRPSLTDNLGADRDEYGVGDEVGTSWEVDDGLSSLSGKDSIDSSSIIGDSVAPCTSRHDIGKAGCRDVLVLRPGALKESAVCTAEEVGGDDPLGSNVCTSDKVTSASRVGISPADTPGLDCLCSTADEGCAIVDSDGVNYVLHPHVVEDKLCSVGLSTVIDDGWDKDGSVNTIELGVEDND